jgi:hypothetical protein
VNFFSILLFGFLFAFNALCAGEIQDSRDFQSFLYTLGLKDIESSEDSTLRQNALSEMAASGLSAEELYKKIQGILARLERPLRIVSTLRSQIIKGDFKTKTQCLEIGACVGYLFGLSVRLSVGLVKSPRFTFPIISGKIQTAKSGSGRGIALGALLELGKSERTDETGGPLFLESESEKTSVGSAFIMGEYERNSQNEKGDGFLMGLGFWRGTRVWNGINLKIPIPFYWNNFEAGIVKDLVEISKALLSLDFAVAQRLVMDFENKVVALEAKMAKRGLVILPVYVKNENINLDELPEDHPLKSPGKLFNPRVVLRLAPDILASSVRESAQRCSRELTDKKRNIQSIPRLMLGD